MEKRPLNIDMDLDQMRQLMTSLPNGPTIVDFEESIQMENVQKTTRLWMENDRLIAFAFVDDFDNLCFEIAPFISNDILENEIVQWGVECQRSKQPPSSTLDHCSKSENLDRIALLKRYGFVEQAIRSLHYSRPLSDTVKHHPLPKGFQIRLFQKEKDIQAWISLHQASFESDQMDLEYRKAIMGGPEYRPDMDWVITAPDGTLAAFCLGCIDQQGTSVGYLDPIGVHPSHSGKGLGAALLAHGLITLFQLGLTTARLGTNSENLPMQKLAEKMGFTIYSESVWFSKSID